VNAEHVGIIRAVSEVAAASVTVLSVLQVLPAIASVFAIVWYAISAFEKISGTPFSETRFAKFLSRK
jgi:hypothetical protein